MAKEEAANTVLRCPLIYTLPGKYLAEPQAHQSEDLGNYCIGMDSAEGWVTGLPATKRNTCHRLHRPARHAALSHGLINRPMQTTSRNCKTTVNWTANAQGV